MLSAPWDPSNCPVCTPAAGVWDPACKATQPVPFGSQGASPPSPPSRARRAAAPCEYSRGAARQHVPVTWRLRCPGVLLPWWAQRQAPQPPHRGPEHQAHTTSRGHPHSHTHRHYDGVSHQRCSVVHGGCPSPPGLGIGQPGFGTSAAQGRMCWPAIPACVRPCPTQPNPH